MKVSQLIESLQNLDPNLEVVWSDSLNTDKEPDYMIVCGSEEVDTKGWDTQKTITVKVARLVSIERL